MFSPPTRAIPTSAKNSARPKTTIRFISILQLLTGTVSGNTKWPSPVRLTLAADGSAANRCDLPRDRRNFGTQIGPCCQNLWIAKTVAVAKARSKGYPRLIRCQAATDKMHKLGAIGNALAKQENLRCGWPQSSGRGRKCDRHVCVREA